MKNNIVKFYITVFYLCLSLAAFAQANPGSGGNGNGGLEGGDAAPVPIDDSIWVLAVVGVIFVFMKFRAIRKNSIQQ